LRGMVHQWRYDGIHSVPIECREAGVTAAGDPPLDVVTVQTGSRYPDVYVKRLRSMLARHLHRPFRLIVYADVLTGRRFGPDVEIRDCSAWGLVGVYNKLRLFDPIVTGIRPFIYFDITLVVCKALKQMIDFGMGTGASLVAVRDWNYPVLNSSVMWIRPDENTKRVWEEWSCGRQFDGHMQGDQNYIHAVFAKRFPEALEYWPGGMVASYKGLRKMSAHTPWDAKEAMAQAVILKFHGHPKPHEVLQPWLHMSSTVFRNISRPRLWRYLAGEIAANWR
jgi:hypothetical protein